MLRRLLLTLPAVAVGIVLWAVLTTGWPAPVTIARVVGGPTLNARVLAWQLTVQRLANERREPSPGLGVRLLVDSGSEQATWSGTTDGAGRAEARVQLAAPLQRPARVRVETLDGQRLAEGSVALDGKEWRSGVRRQGAVLAGKRQGELWVEVWAQEGTLAVPFASELLIVVSGGGFEVSLPGEKTGAQRITGAELELELSGAERTAPGAPLRTDEHGQVRLGVRPLEHAVLLQVRARLPVGVEGTSNGPERPPFLPRVIGPASGEWYGALPVTPGAIHAALDGTELLVRSPIPRDEAFLSLTDGLHRLAGYSVPLTADADGGASARVPLDAELLAGADELWAVVSSEPDKRSASAVGWLIKSTMPSDPALTFDVADQLLLDGTDGVLQSERAARLARRRTAGTLLALVGMTMLGTFALEARRSARRAAAAPRELELVSQRRWLALALGCLLLGIGALAYFGLLQR